MRPKRSLNDTTFAAIAVTTACDNSPYANLLSHYPDMGMVMMTNLKVISIE